MLLALCVTSFTPAQAQWDIIPSPFTGSLYSVEARADGSKAYIGGSYKLMKSTDGGASWEVVLDFMEPGAPIGSLVNDIALPTATRVFLASNAGRLIITLTDGDVWTSTAAPTENGFSINTVQFTDAGYGFLGGQLGDAAQTANGGITWTQGSFGVYKNINDIAFFPGDYTDVGLAVGEEGVIRRTSNFGFLWVGSSSGVADELFGIGVLNEDVVVVVGDNGRILRSPNRGMVWTTVPSVTTERLQAVAFSDELHGFAVGDEGTLLRSDDGGLTWSPEVSGVTADLYDITVVGEYFVAVGLGGTIIRTPVEIGVPEPASAGPSLQVFPDPAMDQVTVRWGAHQLLELRLIDTMGRTLMRKQGSLGTEISIDVGTLDNGSYCIMVRSDQGTTSSRLVVQHGTGTHPR